MTFEPNLKDKKEPVMRQAKGEPLWQRKEYFLNPAMGKSSVCSRIRKKARMTKSQ